MCPIPSTNRRSRTRNSFGRGDAAHAKHPACELLDGPSAARFSSATSSNHLEGGEYDRRVLMSASRWWEAPSLALRCKSSAARDRLQIAIDVVLPELVGAQHASRAIAHALLVPYLPLLLLCHVFL